MFLFSAKSERLQPEPIASSLIYSWRCFPTHLTKSFQQLIVRNAPPPSLSCTFWLNYSTFTLPPSITFFDKLQLAANFAGKIFNLTLSPLSLFLSWILHFQSRGKFWDAVSPLFCLFPQAVACQMFKSSTFRSSQDGGEAVERCQGNCPGEVCAAVARWTVVRFLNPLLLAVLVKLGLLGNLTRETDDLGLKK